MGSIYKTGKPYLRFFTAAKTPQGPLKGLSLSMGLIEIRSPLFVIQKEYRIKTGCGG